MERSSFLILSILYLGDGEMIPHEERSFVHPTWTSQSMNCHYNDSADLPDVSGALLSHVRPYLLCSVTNTAA
jgi:hypothetical protein